jgi:pilus assembly protein Flp/PilA
VSAVEVRRTSVSGGPARGPLGNKEIPVLDYLRIMLAPRLAQRDERGASAVEYGLLIAGIAALIVAIVFIFGDNIADIFSETCDKVAGGDGSGTCAKD